MCGISGSFGFKEEQKFSKHLRDVEPLLKRRGPDQLNIIDIDNFFAAHSRLIVQGDLEDGIQPMRYQNIVILFNGNLYNKDNLKVHLESYGYIFRGVSDTEVVAISSFHWGLDAFNKFNGFFSIAS